MSKYSKDCRICRAEQEAEIQQLKDEIEIHLDFISIQKFDIEALEKQVEAAKTILNEHKVMYLSLDQQLRLRKVLEAKL